MDDNTLFNNAPIPILILDPEGNIQCANAAAQDFYGYTAEELVGMSIAALAAMESRLQQERALQRAVQGQQEWNGLVNHVSREGALHTVRLYLTPVTHKHAQTCQVLCYVFDLSEAISIQRILQREADRLEAILESVNDAIFMIDTHGTVVAANLQFERLFSLQRYDVLDHSLAELVARLRTHPDLPPDLANILLNFSSDRTQSASYEFEISGTPRRVIRWYTEPVYAYSGDSLGRLFVFRDATQELALDRTKTEFLSLVTHELGTPLSAIKNAVEMLLDDTQSALSEEGRQYVQIVEQRVELLETLVKDIIALTRIEAGRIELRCAYHSLKAALNEALNSVRSLIASRRQTLHIEIPDDLPLVWIDRNRIAQVFTNLLTNASKYTYEEGTLLVRAARVDQPWELPEGSPTEVRLPAVLVMVQDTGIGISLEEQTRIFDRFYRTEDARQRRIQGSGLGLTIVQSFVTLHGGKVWLRSAPMRGSAFFFTLPIVEGQ